MLSREIVNEMKGCSISYTLFPYSFREILELKNIDIPHTEILARPEKRGEIIAIFQDFLQHGGYPESLDDLAIIGRMLQSYIDVIACRDVEERFNVEPLLLSSKLEYLSS